MRALLLTAALGLAALLTAPGSALAAAGDLDPSFSGDGIAVSPHQYSGGARGGAVAIDSHGRIVVANLGYIERYMPNGTLDKSFSGDGEAHTPCGSIESMAIDSQNRIVVAGDAPNPADPEGRDVFAVGRLNVNGTPDSSFSGDGCVLTPIGGVKDDEARGVTIDHAGRIVASGISLEGKPAGSSFAVARYMPDGSPDNSFSGDGQLRTDFPHVAYARGGGVALDSKGRIVVSGLADSRFAVARYGPRGGLDPSFSGDGMVTTAMGAESGYPPLVTIDDSDRIVVGGSAYPTGSSNSHLALARYRPNGALDQSFSSDGKAFTSFGRDRNGATDLAIDDLGRIVVSAAIFDGPNNTRSAFALARYTSGGALDPSFSGDGRVTTPIGEFSLAGGVAFDAAGRIVVGGYTGMSPSHTAVARYLGG
jgi:uncharacterized delta-60 repeat protein